MICDYTNWSIICKEDGEYLPLHVFSLQPVIVVPFSAPTKITVEGNVLKGGVFTKSFAVDASGSTPKQFPIN